MNGELQDSSAKRLLEALAEINRLLHDHAVQVRRLSVVTNAQACLEPVTYASGPILEGYVEANLKNGDTICWCLDVRWTHDSWAVETTLDRKTGDRQQTLRELRVETANDLDGFLKALNRVVRELLTLSITDAETAETGSGR